MSRRLLHTLRLLFCLPFAFAIAACPDSMPEGPVGVPSDSGGRVDALFDSGSDASGDSRPFDLPDVPVGAQPRMQNFWGGLGREPGEFVEPSSIELDSDGFVYVAGHEDRFQKFTREGELVAIFGEAGSGEGQFNHPHGLAVDRRRGDLVYVGDQENHRLQVFTSEGEFVRLWGDEEFIHIHDVGIDPESGDLFVGDLELHQIRKFGPTGELLATYGEFGRGPGQFNAVWGISTDSAGNVYVADTNNFRVQKFDREGRFISAWLEFEGTLFSKPTGIFVDARDVVYVTDSLRGEVLSFDTEGRPLERWDLNALAGFQTEPEDIVIDEAGEHIYVAEVRFHRVIHLVRSAP